MAIGDIQYIYDHIRFYSRALRPEKNNRDNKKNSIETCKKTLSKP